MSHTTAPAVVFDDPAAQREPATGPAAGFFLVSLNRDVEPALRRLAEAGESDVARHAHLAYFTDLTETADPRLRRAEQLDWLTTLEVEHDNIGSAMRGALVVQEAGGACAV